MLDFSCIIYKQTIIIMQEGGGKWWCNTKQWVQKQYFKVTHTIDNGFNNETAQDIWLFGNHYEKNQLARLIYSSTLWFTYRQNINFQGSNVTSDVGWGCMLRVGQMVIAQALRRAEGIQKYDDIQTVKSVIQTIIQPYQTFSIESLVKEGQKLFQKGVEEWFTPSQTAFILKEIQNRNKKSKLRIMVYLNEFQTTSALEYLNTKNTDKMKNITASTVKKNKQNIKYNEHVTIYPGLIIILVRIGMNSPQQDMLQSVLEMMKLPAFMGILGGRVGKAHYIIGTSKQNFIYLDPHFVKSKTDTNNFFSQHMFSMPHEKVDTSMGLCFYVHDFKGFIGLSDGLKSLKQNNVFYSYSVVDQPRLVEIITPEIFQILGFEQL